MGLMQRRKGKTFEQYVARRLEERFPGVEAHRSQQAEEAHDSDVTVGAAPRNRCGLLLRRIWWECQHAAKPTPTAKLAQAEYDCTGKRCDTDGSLVDREFYGWSRIPVAVTKANGSQPTLTIRAGHLLDICGADPGRLVGPPVTMLLEDFFDLLIDGQGDR